MSIEHWREIRGYEGRYQVSDFGRVRSMERFVQCNARPRRVRERVLKQCINKRGYRFVTLSAYSRRDPRLVHQLVLEAFTGDRPDGMESRHLDGNPANNAVSNLCWGTHTENIDDRNRHGRQPRGEAVRSSKLDARTVVQIRRAVKAGELQKTLARRYRVSTSTISEAVNKRCWRHV